MRKLIYLVAGSLCMSAAMTSCVDDEESNEVKEMRQVQLNQMKLDLEQDKADLDQTYWNMYNSAISKVKTLENDKKNFQLQLDDVKSGNVTLADAKDAIVKYNDIRIAQAEKDIQDEEAVKTIYKNMDIKSAEDLKEEEIKAEIEMNKANSARLSKWTEITNDGYNYNNVDASYGWNTKLSELLGGSSNYWNNYYEPTNHKLQGTDFIAAAEDLYNNSSDFSFYDYYRKNPNYSSYYLENVIEFESVDLKDDGVAYYSYTKYKINTDDYANLLAMLKDNVDSLMILSRNDNSWTDTYNDYAEKKTAIEAKYKALTDNISAYNTMLTTLEGLAKDVYALEMAYNKAVNIYNAYGYSSLDKEVLVMQCESRINTLREAIVNYKDLKEQADNDIVDNATLNTYYTLVISQIENDIKIQQSIADKYYKLLTSSNSSSSESTNTPANTEE
ncbi:MAG: hypothetical protein J6U13_00985 [Salinivirgaceae bacterium]|nr:hypothetical protein [Salinivirgaceae bacterium]MBR5167101.1 hypothetical protein [Salinivirgaceae bacterium]